MKTLRSFRVLLVGTCLLTHAATAVAQSPSASADRTSAEADRMFQELDADRNGSLTIGEGGPGIQHLIRRLFEMNAKPDSGAIGLDEFREIYERHRRHTDGGSPSPEREPAPRRQRPMVTDAGAAPQPPRERGRPVQENAPASARLQGVWRGWVVDGRGENPNTGHMEMELRIEGNRMTARELSTNRAPEGLGDGTFVVGGSGDSGTLDAVANTGRHPGKDYPGIFTLDGDTLRWCVNNHNRQTQRPQGYETGRGFYFMVLRRQRGGRD